LTTPSLSWEHRLMSLAHAPLEHKHEHIAVKADRATLQLADWVGLRVRVQAVRPLERVHFVASLVASQHPIR